MQITVSGVSHAFQTVSRYTDIDVKLHEVAKRLCEIGEPIIAQIHGHHATRLETVETNNGYKIVCEGADILFIEFGAGDAAGSENYLYDAVPVSARPGSWSEAHGGQYALHKATEGKGYWFFGGHMYTEVPPSPAFYYAYEYMCQNLPMIVREVFQ